MRIIKTKNVIIPDLCHRCSQHQIRHIITLYNGAITLNLALCDRCAALPPERMAEYALAGPTDAEYKALKSFTHRTFSQQARLDELELLYPGGVNHA